MKEEAVVKGKERKGKKSKGKCLGREDARLLAIALHVKLAKQRTIEAVD